MAIKSDARLFERVCALLEHTDDDVCCTGLMALGYISRRGDEQVVSKIVGELASVSGARKAAALQALGRVARRGDERSSYHIASHLRDQEPCVRHAAHLALARLSSSLVPMRLPPRLQQVHFGSDSTSINCTAWFTCGAKELLKSAGNFYHEVRFDVFPTAPQIGWLTGGFDEQGPFYAGVGDDEHGWAADGVRHVSWHCGASGPAVWPRSWQAGDVIGCAISIESGQMQFSLNGEWIANAGISFLPEGRNFFPAASLEGECSFSILRGTWRFLPPGSLFEAWAFEGRYAWPSFDASPIIVP